MEKLVAALGVLLIPTALWAGEKSPLVEPVCAVPFTGTISAGYESAYIFRGLDLGGYAPWSGIDTSWELLENTSLDLGAWYINPTDSRSKSPSAHANDELDLYATLNFPLWVFKASLGTIFYNYPEAAGNLGADAARNIETNFGLAYSLPWFDLKWLSAFDWNLNYGDGSWYHEISGTRSFDLTNCLTASFAAGVAFYDNYNFIANPALAIPGLGNRPLGVDFLNGYSHSFVTLALTWAMTSKAALDLYVAGNLVSDGLEDLGARGDQLHGGASVSISF